MLKKWKTITNKKGEEYNVLIVFDEQGKITDESSCTCKWGSFHRWTQSNKKDKWMCRHIVKAYAELTLKSNFNAREVLIKQGIMNKNHLRKI